jgi:hypothetical protein
MLFGKKDKNKATDRVLDLKARVDALRAADDASRKKAYSLDHFLEGDDVLAGREVEDEYKAQGFEPSVPGEHAAPAASDPFEANLQAELDKYIRRQAELGKADDPPAAHDTPVKPPPHPENTSLILDGTWSRDEAPPPPANRQAVEPSGAWPGEDASWSSPTEPASESPAKTEWDDSAWTDSKNWPPEEEWPPHEKAV